MKRIIALLMLCALCLFSLPSLAEEGPRAISVREWLDAEGETGDCLLEVEILEIVNPVWAVVGDGSGSVNLFGLRFYDCCYGFGENGFIVGDRITLRDPGYNVFEGTVEMTDTELVTFTAAGTDGTRVSVREWLESRGEVNGYLYVKFMELLNPVLAGVADETGAVNVFLIRINGEERNFEGIDIPYGTLAVLDGAEYNEFEGSVEMAGPEVLRVILPLQEE